jgi:hypothetical protein
MFHYRRQQQISKGGNKMYGLPSDPEIDVLKGQSLIQVCFGENDLFLNFSGNISVGTYSCIGLGSNGEDIAKISDFAKSSQTLLQLLSVSVSGVSWTKEGAISITFETGRIVEFYDDSQQFESYTIKLPGRSIVV